MIKVIQGTSNTVVNYASAPPQDGDAIRNFVHKHLTTFEFDRKIKRFVVDKRYCGFKRERREFIIPSTFNESLLDFLLSSGIRYQLIPAETYQARALTLTMNPKFVERPEQVPAVEFLVNGPGHRKGLELGTGCLVGDTVINFNRCGKGFSMSLEMAYRQFNDLPPSRRRWDKRFPTFTRSFKGDRISLHEVDDIVYSGEKEVFEVTLDDGKTLTGTSDHEILTSSGYVRLVDLIGHDVMIDSPRAVASGRRVRKLHDNNFHVTDRHPYGRKMTSDGRTRYRIAPHRAIYEAWLNGMDISEYKLALKCPVKVSTMKFVDPGKHVIHHKDHDHYNNAQNNLEMLTHDEHYAHHGEEAVFNFNQGLPAYAKAIRVVPRGIQLTYDIICLEPHKNFVANGIVVHNCGKTFCSIKSMVRLGKVGMIVVSGLTDQWIEAFGEQTDIGDKIYLIQGFASLARLFKSDKKPEVFVCSLETIREYIKGEGDYGLLPPYHKFISYYGIGTKIVDEAHLNFHANVLIDLAANVQNNIYLTATFLTADKSLNKIFTTVYPSEMRYGSGALNKYMHIYFYGYRSNIMESKCTTAMGYSHSKYEEVMMKRSSVFLDWYERVLLPIAKIHYFNDEVRRQGKLLIFCSTLVFIERIVACLKQEYPDKVIASYTGEDEKDVLDTTDIIVSTHKGCGTGNDIKNLRCVINTISFKAATTATQVPGRLREIKGVELHYIDMLNLEVPAHIRHWQERSPLYKIRAAEYKEYKLP